MTVFRPPSAESVATLTGELTAAVTPASAATVGADLAAVAEVLRGEGALRRVFTDAAVATDAEITTLRTLFGGRISDAALDLVISAVSKRWRTGADLPAAFDYFGTVALVTSAGAAGPQVVTELFEVGQLVRTTPELRDALTDPVYPVSAKKELLAGLLRGKVQDATIELARQALGAPGPFVAALGELRAIAASVLGGLAAVVHVAKPLAPAQLDRITATLSAQYGATVYANEVVDPGLLGGVSIEIGDDVIDGSTITRLEEAGRRLAG